MKIRNALRRNPAPAPSVEDHELLKRRVTRLTKTVEELVVREARLQEELKLVRRELSASRVSVSDR